MFFKASREHITVSVLNSIIKLTKYLVLVPNPNGTILLKQLLDHILFNPLIWIYCSVEVFLKTYLNDLDKKKNFKRFRPNYFPILPQSLLMILTFTLIYAEFRLSFRLFTLLNITTGLLILEVEVALNQNLMRQ